MDRLMLSAIHLHGIFKIHIFALNYKCYSMAIYDIVYIVHKTHLWIHSAYMKIYAKCMIY
jgi:hypothetical protein